jgi:hypothetical protein
MAIFISGKTKCLVCGQAINSAAGTIFFPAFLKAGHRLARFSDAAIHGDCLQTSEDALEAHRLLARYQEIWRSRPRNLSLDQAEAWGREAFKELDT